MKTKGNQARLASKKKKEQQQQSETAPAANEEWVDPQSTIYFWQEHERHYGFLSQWAPSPFEVDGTLYHTAEHWMMVGKAQTFGDTAKIDKILKDPRPGQAKTQGKLVKGFDMKIWLQRCDAIVEEGNMHKFGKNDRLRKQLLKTGDRELVEASPSDRVWGVGFRAEQAEEHRGEWGQNRLGNILMRVRERLREEENGAGPSVHEAQYQRQGFEPDKDHYQD